MKRYTFKPYSSLYPFLFEQEKNRILSQLKKTVTIEHVGNTAIVGLGGKGIIDIAIGVEKLNMEESVQELQKLGYELRANVQGRFLLKSDTYSLHVTAQ
jgi:GrpB-like predicted nucleotidyltransferase (UPF0157 family)